MLPNDAYREIYDTMVKRFDETYYAMKDVYGKL